MQIRSGVEFRRVETNDAQTQPNSPASIERDVSYSFRLLSFTVYDIFVSVTKKIDT